VNLGKAPRKYISKSACKATAKDYTVSIISIKQENKMTPEAKVKASVVKLLKKHEVYHFFPATHGFGRSGVPDIICCYNSLFMGIECKAGKGKTTALQDRELQRINDNGGVTFVVNEETIEELKQYLNGDDDRC
jgi:Holliday junction resolvase